ncbi:hypothetical protein M5K25_012313 [Dendrobium thyrsiflorum]|uniref:Uncharacterized protein n=1 Tax=Dendrobium thyrsiflorum TaxID=117978 RepID=A0ABD0V4F2_DENTH
MEHDIIDKISQQNYIDKRQSVNFKVVLSTFSVCKHHGVIVISAACRNADPHSAIVLIKFINRNRVCFLPSRNISEVTWEGAILNYTIQVGCSIEHIFLHFFALGESPVIVTSVRVLMLATMMCMGVTAERRAPGGGPAERWALGGGPEERRASGGGLIERRASSGGLAEPRALDSGSEERRASGGGSAERRALVCGPAECRASGDGPTERSALDGGPAECPASGGGQAKRRASGGGPAALWRQVVV